MKRTANREAYWNENCQKLQDNERVENKTEILIAEIATLKEQLSLRSNEIKELKQLIDELNIENIQLRNIEEVSLFGENTNSYIPELHACVNPLLDCHVSCENVSSVIGYVLKLCNKKPNKLPSVSTINNWSVERALIARRHIFQKLVRKKIQFTH